MQAHTPINTNKQILALCGGQKTITNTFTVYNSIGEEEKIAVQKVLESGVLSQYIGAWHPHFYGGPKVLEFEDACRNYFKVKHAVTFNSLTSGLIAAVGAIGIEPGDEVIVSPWTMAASATAILHWNAIPVFADIDPHTFCIDTKSIESNLSPNTKAIIAVDIFGQSADMKNILSLAKKHGLKVISDSAQAPAAKYKDQYAGTLADIGGYSLNYHKHIHTGEGGIMVTNDDELAERLQLIRNHAEVVVAAKPGAKIDNMIGHNFRLSEIECAIGVEQLKKLPHLVNRKSRQGNLLSSRLKNLPGLKVPSIGDVNTHVFYVYGLVLNLELLQVSRDKIHQALIAEGVPALAKGYQNVHLLPIYQQKIAYGKKGFPWNNNICKRNVDYKKGICPIAEKLHDHNFMYIAICVYDFTDEEINLIADAFEKVWDNMDELRKL